MRMGTNLIGPASVGLGAVNDLQAECCGRRAEIGDVLIGGEPRAEGLTNEADQRSQAQRQKRAHLLDNAEPRRHVLRVHRSRSHALIEQEWRDADDDMGLPESIGLTAHGGQ